jgi:hypothetical protein
MINYIRAWYIKKLLSNCLYALADLQQAFFVNYLKKDYIKQRKYYQNDLNKRSKTFFLNMTKTSDAIKHYSQFKDIFSKINHLSEIIFSLNQLRFRVVDYTTFKVCIQEMQNIEKFSNMMIIQLANYFFKKISIEVNVFEDTIHQFENIYNRALQIVAIDPLVFMFFIQDLYALNEELTQLSNAILCLKDKKNVNIN